MTDTVETVDGAEVKPCGMNERHGAHDWYDLPSDSETFRCEGLGLVTVSWSELDAFRQCPMKWRLAYRERWQREPTDTGALGKGSMWHRVLEVHYRTIMAHQVKDADGNVARWDVDYDTLQQACIDAVAAELDKMKHVEERDGGVIVLLQWMYAGHLETYGLDESWDILSVESTHVVPLYEVDGSESWVRLKIKLDLVVRDHRGRVWVVDHKSCGTLPRDSKDFDWADQFGLYYYGLTRIGMRITGTIHSAAKTKMNQGDLIKPGEPGYKKSMKETAIEDRFGRTFMNYTEAQVACIASDALADFKLAYSDFNRGQRNPDEERCGWRCDFTEACMFGRRTGRDSDVLDMLQRTGFEQNFTRH